MKIVAVLGAMLCPIASNADAGRVCEHYSTPYYTEALAQQLTKNGAAITRNKDGALCYSLDLKPHAAAAREAVDRYFFGAMDVVRTPCRERTYVEWARAKGLPFYILGGRGPDGKAVRMFHIASFSAEERERNTDLLTRQSHRPLECKAGEE